MSYRPAQSGPVFSRVGTLAQLRDFAADAKRAGYTVTHDETGDLQRLRVTDPAKADALVMRAVTVRPGVVAFTFSESYWQPAQVPDVRTPTTYAAHLSQMPVPIGQPAAPAPVKRPQCVAGHSVRILIRKGETGKGPGQRVAEIDGGRQFVPVELLPLTAGRDAWCREIAVRCLDCRKPTPAGEMECELCPTCYDKAGEENAEQDGG